MANSAYRCQYALRNYDDYILRIALIFSMGHTEKVSTEENLAKDNEKREREGMKVVVVSSPHQSP